MPRILVLVLSIDREPWRTIEHDGQRRTWAAPAVRPPGCNVIFYYGHEGSSRHLAQLAARAHARPAVSWLSRTTAARPCELSGDRLVCDVPEAYRFTLPKLLAALRFAVREDFDFVYRTNTSTYLNLEALQSAADALPRERCYGGWIIRRRSDGLPFASGGGMLMSRDIVESLAARDDWNWGTTDDAAVGEAAVAMGVEPIQLDRVRVRDAASAEMLTAEQLRTTFNYRCKTADRNDQDAMVAIHHRLGKSTT
jgi:hypothetical protein